MSRSILFPLLLLAACSAPHLEGVETLRAPSGLALHHYHFAGGASLVVASDQGVPKHRLRVAEGGFLVEWGRSQRTLRIEDGLVRIVEEQKSLGAGGWLAEGVAQLGEQPLLLLQGNGEARVVSLQDAEHRFGVNAQAFVGVTMNADRIMGVLPDSPASRAGLRKGDRLKAIEVAGRTHELRHRLDFALLLPRLHPKDRVVFRVQREGKELGIPVLLGARPSALWNKTDG